MTHPDLSPAKTGPDVSFAVRQVLPSLVLDLAMPICSFFVLRACGVSTLIAIVAGGAFPLVNVGRGWLGSRRIEPLGIIVITCIVVGTAVALISGSVRIALLKDFLLTGSFGLLFLASAICAKRPLMFYLLRQFIAGSDPVRLQWWEGLWQHPRFRTALIRVTIVWGSALSVQALVGSVLAYLLVPSQVVVISRIVGFGVLIGLIAWTRVYLLAIWKQQTAKAAPT